MGDERTNIAKELDEATSLYTGLMTSTPAKYHPQGPLGKHIVHVEP